MQLPILNFTIETLLVIFTFMNLVFLISLIIKRNDIADIAWGVGFLTVSLYWLFRSGMFLQTQIIISFLVFTWAARLSLYIFLRNKGKSEDFRYKEWKDKWQGSKILQSYLKVFLLQGFFMFLISLPVTLYNSFNGNLWMITFFGLIVWVIGFIIETISDLQVYFFKKDSKNKGKILKSGLWKYSRHPNYFGEVLIWWGIWILTLGSQYYLVSVIGPLTITYLITKVSGIPLLEKRYENDKEYQEYAKKTSIFIPWFQKK